MSVIVLAPCGVGENNQREQGFSLIEMSIVVAVFALMLTAVMQLQTVQQEETVIAKTEITLDKVERALMYYFALKGHLPCPASRIAAPDEVAYGTSTNCNASPAAGTFDVGSNTDQYQVRYGALPTRTIGLSDHDSLDGWGNKFSYAIIRELGKGAAQYSAYSPTQSSNYFQMRDEDNAIIYGSNNTEIIAYALISHGVDKRGAFTRNGTASLSCGTTTDALDAENCDVDTTEKIFIVAPVHDHDDSSDYYYDLVRWQHVTTLNAL